MHTCTFECHTMHKCTVGTYLHSHIPPAARYVRIHGSGGPPASDLHIDAAPQQGRLPRNDGTMRPARRTTREEAIRSERESWTNYIHLSRSFSPVNERPSNPNAAGRRARRTLSPSPSTSTSTSNIGRRWRELSRFPPGGCPFPGSRGSKHARTHQLLSHFIAPTDYCSTAPPLRVRTDGRTDAIRCEVV